MDAEMQTMPIAEGSKTDQARALLVPHLTRKNGFICIVFLIGCMLILSAIICVPNERDHILSPKEKELLSCPATGIDGTGPLVLPKQTYKLVFAESLGLTRKAVFMSGMLALVAVCCCPCFSIDSIRNETELVRHVRARRAVSLIYDVFGFNFSDQTGKGGKGKSVTL